MRVMCECRALLLCFVFFFFVSFLSCLFFLLSVAEWGFAAVFFLFFFFTRVAA